MSYADEVIARQLACESKPVFPIRPPWRGRDETIRRLLAAVGVRPHREAMVADILVRCFSADDAERAAQNLLRNLPKAWF